MLTDIAIKTAKPQDRPLKIFDGGGLFVMVNPNGSKLWRLKYRHQGKERLASFGAYPIVSLKNSAVWIVPGARMKMGKEHLVPLSRQVLRLLEELRTINADSRYVFASPINRDKHISNNTILFAYTDSATAGDKLGTAFAAWFSTIANEERELGSHSFGPEVIERELPTSHSPRVSLMGKSAPRSNSGIFSGCTSELQSLIG